MRRRKRARGRQVLLRKPGDTGRWLHSMPICANAARACAWLDGREHVIPEDVQNIMPCVAGHRLHATSRESGRALHGKELVSQLIGAVPVP